MSRPSRSSSGAADVERKVFLVLSFPARLGEQGSVRVRRHLWLSGRVQGVYFRESTREQAERLGVDGWVRNLPDGRVEAVLEGAPAAVDALVAWCRGGPPAAHVSAVEDRPEPPQDERGFRVER